MPFGKEGESDRKEQTSKKKKSFKSSFLACRNLHVAGNSFPFSATGSGVEATAGFGGIMGTLLVTGFRANCQRLG